MSQIYSKMTVGLGLTGILLYGFYRKFLNGENFNHGGISNQNTRQVTRDMLQQMQRTQNTIFQLQREIEALREQIRFNKESIQSFTSMQPRESVTIAIGTDDFIQTRERSSTESGKGSTENESNPEHTELPQEINTADLNSNNFEQTTYATKVNENYARSTQVHFISKSKIKSPTNFQTISNPIKTRSDTTMISSFAAPTPASDDDCWITPSASEASSVSGGNFESGINSIAAHCVQSLQSLDSINSLGPEYKYIARDITTYTPLPSKHLPMNTRNFITKIDKLTGTICPEIDKNVEEVWNLLMENKNELEIYLELTWRVCRAAVYLRTVYLMLKKTKKASFFVGEGLRYAKIGEKMMVDLHPYNINSNEEKCANSDNKDTTSLASSENYEYDYISQTNSEKELFQEIKITALAPMAKWAGSIIGVSAEIAPGIQDKINAGFKARDQFKKSIQLDPFDYFAYYNLARWHWEIYNLPSLLKRSANWISSEPFNSRISDVMVYVEQCLEKFPKDKDLFKTVPADIYLMKANCLGEEGDKKGCKTFAELAKGSLERNWKKFDKIGSILDKATLNEIDKMLQKC